jgi:choline dehydrogenase
MRNPLTSSSLARRLFLKLFGASAAATAAGCGEAGPRSSTSDVTEGAEFDYVIVGSGAGGGPLAANLARQGLRVLLLEAGGDHGDSQVYQVPAFHPQSTEAQEMRWDYFVQHYDDPEQQALDSKVTPDGVLYPRAGTLGGCTAHNAMITVYPHARDWDDIAAMTGDSSWSATEMRRYMEILENCLYAKPDTSAAKGHGFGGWLSTTMPDASLVVTDLKLQGIVIGAARAFAQFLGLREVIKLMKRDLNADSPDRDHTEGLFTIPMHTDGQKRIGPREYILRTIAEGHPLVLRQHALVSRVLFSDETAEDGTLRAIGVEYLEGEHLYRADPLASADGAAGTPRTAMARHEVVLSAGTFNTPQLLKLSGIGPADELAPFAEADPAFRVLLDLPGVGRNLQDRYEVGVISQMDSDLESIADCTFGLPGDPCLEQWHNGEGVYASNGGVVGIVKRSASAITPEPDLFIFGLPGKFKGYHPGYSAELTTDKRHFTWAVLKAHTQNDAGTVTLRSLDPRDVPDIRFRYFHEGTAGWESDLGAMVEGVEFVREIIDRTDGLLLFSGFEEVLPGPSADIQSFVRNEAWGHHASCTCRIGPDGDAMAVLDASFRVRGTTGLRVVDASVFPRVPGFFPVLAIYMLAEKATDVLLANIGQTRKF